MANVVGTIACSKNAIRAVCLMVGQTTNTGAPATATDGVPNYPDESIYASDTGACFAACAARESFLSIITTAGSGTCTGTFTLWGFVAAANAGAGAWVPVVKVNAAAAISQTAPVAFAERELDLGLFDRLYLQLAAISGTSAAFEAWLSTARTVSY